MQWCHHYCPCWPPSSSRWPPPRPGSTPGPSTSPPSTLRTAAAWPPSTGHTRWPWVLRISTLSNTYHSEASGWWAGPVRMAGGGTSVWGRRCTVTRCAVSAVSNTLSNTPPRWTARAGRCCSSRPGTPSATWCRWTWWIETGRQGDHTTVSAGPGCRLPGGLGHQGAAPHAIPHHYRGQVQCSTVQYSTVQHSTAAVCPQSVQGGASVNISAASPQLSSLYCNTVIQWSTVI